MLKGTCWGGAGAAACGCHEGLGCAGAACTPKHSRYFMMLLHLHLAMCQPSTLAHTTCCCRSASTETHIHHASLPGARH
jgi:hypothetical protein